MLYVETVEIHQKTTHNETPREVGTAPTYYLQYSEPPSWQTVKKTGPTLPNSIV